MRRRYVHTAFAAAALVCAAAVAYHGVQLHRAAQINAAIANASASEHGISAPEARLARATALERSGDTDAAVKLYKELARGSRADLRSIALYNLGNLYMRRAQAAGDGFARLPLLELAKQSYRDVLRNAPYDWDARYNLERALWLAPESWESAIGESVEDDAEERVMSTIQGTRADLP